MFPAVVFLRCIGTELTHHRLICLFFFFYQSKSLASIKIVLALFALMEIIDFNYTL